MTSDIDNFSVYIEKTKRILESTVDLLKDSSHQGIKDTAKSNLYVDTVGNSVHINKKSGTGSALTILFRHKTDEDKGYFHGGFETFLSSRIYKNNTKEAYVSKTCKIVINPSSEIINENGIYDAIALVAETFVHGIELMYNPKTRKIDTKNI